MTNRRELFLGLAAISAVGVQPEPKVVELNVRGNFYGPDGIRQLAEDLRDYLDESDVVLFGSNSRQAQTLKQ